MDIKKFVVIIFRKKEKYLHAFEICIKGYKIDPCMKSYSLFSKSLDQYVRIPDIRHYKKLVCWCKNDLVIDDGERCWNTKPEIRGPSELVLLPLHLRQPAWHQRLDRRPQDRVPPVHQRVRQVGAAHGILKRVAGHLLSPAVQLIKHFKCFLK